MNSTINYVMLRKKCIQLNATATNQGTIKMSKAKNNREQHQHIPKAARRTIFTRCKKTNQLMYQVEPKEVAAQLRSSKL